MNPYPELLEPAHQLRLAQALRSELLPRRVGPGARRGADDADDLHQPNRTAARSSGREPLEHGAVGGDREDGWHDRDAVLSSEVGPFAHIELDERIGLAGEAPLPFAARTAQRMGERNEDSVVPVDGVEI